MAPPGLKGGLGWLSFLGPPPAPARRSFHWASRPSAQAPGLLSAPPSWEHPSGSAVVGGTGRSCQPPILHESAPLPSVKSLSPALGSVSRGFWHQKEPSVNLEMWPVDAGVPMGTSGWAAALHQECLLLSRANRPALGCWAPLTPGGGCLAWMTHRDQGSRQRKPGTSASSLETCSPCFAGALVAGALP